MTTPIIFDPLRELGSCPRPALLEWLAQEGCEIREGAPLMRYEVDKAVQDFPSPVSGYLRRRLVPAGARFSPGDVLALGSPNPSDPVPENIRLAPLPSEEDIHGFDWSEIDNRSGPAEPLGVMRRAIANRMAMSKRHIPCFYLTATVDMTGCHSLRRKLKKTGRKATYNDMAIKACAMALVQNPRAAAVYTPQGSIPRSDINIGFAAALPDDGLVVPVIKNADRKALADVAAETRQLAEKAKHGELTPTDCSGGVFSVSYLGSYEVDNFIAIVNPGEASILAMGKTVDTPVVVDGGVAVRPIVKVTLSCDHRSIDGALAARLMGDIKRILEDPDKML